MTDTASDPSDTTAGVEKHGVEERHRLYTCTVGHAIDSARLNEDTEIVVLDAGARVRVCREHGAPVAETLDAATIPDEG